MPRGLYERSARKKAVNLSVNEDLLRQAREMDVNLSLALEQKLAEILRAETQARWAAENREAIERYNESVARRGVFSDGIRRF